MWISLLGLHLLDKAGISIGIFCLMWARSYDNSCIFAAPRFDSGSIILDVVILQFKFQLFLRKVKAKALQFPAKMSLFCFRTANNKYFLLSWKKIANIENIK